MIHAQLRVSLRIDKRGVEVVSPCRDANGSRVVCPLGLWTLEEFFCEDLGDLIVGCVYPVLTEWVCGLYGGDQGCVVREDDGEIGCGIVVANGEDSEVVVSLFVRQAKWLWNERDSMETAYRPSCALVPPKTGIWAMLPLSLCCAGFETRVTLSATGLNSRICSSMMVRIVLAFAALTQVKFDP